MASAFAARLLGVDRFNDTKLPLPSSLLRHDLQVLTRGDYLVAPKHDGVRALLLLFVCDAQPCAALVARNAKTTRFAYTSHEITDHQGTLLDGELSASGHFVVFDAYSASGYDLKACTLPTRLRAVKHHVARLSAAAPVVVKSPLSIEVKRFARADPESVLSAWAAGTLAGFDGIVLAPVDARVCKGRHPTYYKYKPRDQHTVDLAFAPKRDEPVSVLHLCCSAGSALPFTCYPDVPSFARAHRGIVECSVQARDDGGVAIVYLKNRADKSVPNSRFVVDRTIENFVEAIKPEEVADAFQSLRR